MTIQFMYVQCKHTMHEEILHWLNILKSSITFKACHYDILDKKNSFYCILKQCTVFRKAYILSGSGFHKFLYSLIESLRKIREIAEFIPNQLHFHEKNFS